MAMNPFRFFSKPEAGWLSVGLASSFPDIGGDDEGNIAQPRMCDKEPRPGCKVYHVPKEDVSQRAEVPVVADANDALVEGDYKDQVLVFRYKGRFHAVDHQCPHSSYPLSQGAPFDIEDFGVVLSAGISCPKHGWSFDLFTGMADRARYKLNVWEVQLRDAKDSKTVIAMEKCDDAVEKEVWVRRKPRIG